MDPNKVYISAPINLKWSTVTRFAQSLVDNNIQAFAWDRNSIYDQSIFDECGSVIFLLPENRFAAAKDDLPWGLKRELFRAHSQSKKIYVGYGGIYEANTDGDYISGISGTSNSIFTNIGKENSKETLRMYKSGMNLVMNSMYGSFVNDTLYGELNHNPCDSYKVFVPNPCDEVVLPKAERVSAKTISSTLYEECVGYDKRLLLML